MKTHPFLTLLLAVITALGTLGAAEKQKRPDVTDYPFWTAKKRGYVAQFVPGLTAVLELSDAQKERIAAARDEMSNDEAMKAARGISKSDPSVTAEQRDRARAALEAATARLREKVAAILTAEQKALIDKINAAYAAAVEGYGQFLHKLDGLLAPGQKEAMKVAAEREERQNAKAAAVKKNPK